MDPMGWEVPAFSLGHVFVGRGIPRDINLVAEKCQGQELFECPKKSGMGVPGACRIKTLIYSG